VACVTCGGAAREPDGRTRGEQLLERLEHERTARGEIGVEVLPVRCLWACKRSCAVLLRSPARPGYVIAELDASDTTARALLDYALLYARAPDGAVPYKAWPSPLKGHFLCRIPPEPPPRGSADALPPEPALQDAGAPHPEPSEAAPQDPAP